MSEIINPAYGNRPLNDTALTKLALHNTKLVEDNKLL